MSVQFTVLASGSRGNASLIRSGGSGLLIDLGLGPRSLARRMEGVAAGWGSVAAAVLTHTHGDHVQDASLRGLARHKVPFYCHEGHLKGLARFPGFLLLDASRLVRTFDERPFLTPDGLRVEPITLSHDGGPTFGFRVEARARRRGKSTAIGYLADTGCWHDRTADHLADVDLLAVEFNHDVEMQRQSGRAPYLIARNLGDRGHLSNAQGAGLVSAVLERSRSSAVRDVVLLHLSEQCNRPEIAVMEARGAVRTAGRRSRVHAASQWAPSPDLGVTASSRAARAESRAHLFPWEDDGSADDGLFRLRSESA